MDSVGLEINRLSKLKQEFLNNNLEFPNSSPEFPNNSSPEYLSNNNLG